MKNGTNRFALLARPGPSSSTWITTSAAAPRPRSHPIRTAPVLGADLPFYWSVGEGPSIILVGLLTLWLDRGIQNGSARPSVGTK